MTNNIIKQILNNQNYDYTTDSLIAINDSSIIAVDPQTYLDSASFYIASEQYKDAVEPLLGAFIEGYDIFNYNDYFNLFNAFNKNVSLLG